MAETSIEWVKNADGSQGLTWNPIRGCTRVSPGCGGPGPHGGCYAEGIAARFSGPGQPYEGIAEMRGGKPRWTGRLAFVESALDAPLRRRKPTTWFVNSMSDLFHEKVPEEWIAQVFAIMALAPQHTFQVLTKRSARMCQIMAGPKDHSIWHPKLWHRSVLPNVWLGVSAEDQRRADERVPDLLATPAAVRFVSAEPLLGPIDFEAMPFSEGDPRHRWSALTGQAIMHATGEDGHPDFTVRLTKPIRSRLDWIIVGGESGPNARPMHPAWARQIRDACAVAGVPFLFKQHGAWIPEARGRDWAILDADGDLDIPDDRAPDEAAGEVAVTRVGKKAAGRLLDGVEHNGMPEVRP
ncbi:phage Gp37/Gp68 family protein [Methylobacterium symbioticum]|uniref:Phage protein Gp37/Gp68 n=1 Tax=Methylobacterium symbioticum TaxID=2584084 RepID=A0A509EC72_9HYPH|nr:phage Gp37/Gp68 family protein [Methylobacterium symbioticum]VUD71811.1 hypothetical protein MET9862_02399 [Methylobacterium symbioticum]